MSRRSKRQRDREKAYRKKHGRYRKSQNVHTNTCFHNEPGITICTCVNDIQGWHFITGRT